MREWQLPAAVKLTSKSRHAMIPVALREMYVGMSVCCVVSQQPGAALEWGVLTLGAISQQRQLLTRPTQPCFALVSTPHSPSLHSSLGATLPPFPPPFPTTPAAQQPFAPPASSLFLLRRHTCAP